MILQRFQRLLRQPIIPCICKLERILDQICGLSRGRLMILFSSSITPMLTVTGTFGNSSTPRLPSPSPAPCPFPLPTAASPPSPSTLTPSYPDSTFPSVKPSPWAPTATAQPTNPSSANPPSPTVASVATPHHPHRKHDHPIRPYRCQRQHDGPYTPVQDLPNPFSLSLTINLFTGVVITVPSLCHPLCRCLMISLLRCTRNGCLGWGNRRWREVRVHVEMVRMREEKMAEVERQVKDGMDRFLEQHPGDFKECDGEGRGGGCGACDELMMLTHTSS
ncbi:hypothetical protein BC829DRAFT_52145 [Chytridium lagenaria]|nr:hypothetical protein BC829DRAFT_52145 [Chytridium lagenaria]